MSGHGAPSSLILNSCIFTERVVPLGERAFRKRKERRREIGEKRASAIRSVFHLFFPENAEATPANNGVERKRQSPFKRKGKKKYKPNSNRHNASEIFRSQGHPKCAHQI